MATIKLPIAPILETILAFLGLPHTTFEEQQKDGLVFTSTVYYPYGDTEGNRFISHMVGISFESMLDAKNSSSIAALDHLKAIYTLQIVDYNHRELTLLKPGNKHDSNDLPSLREAYNHVCGQYVSNMQKSQKLTKSLKKIKSVIALAKCHM